MLLLLGLLIVMIIDNSNKQNFIQLNSYFEGTFFLNHLFYINLCLKFGNIFRYN